MDVNVKAIGKDFVEEVAKIKREVKYEEKRKKGASTLSWGTLVSKSAQLESSTFSPLTPCDLP